MRLVALVAAVLALALLAAACGGDDEPAAGEATANEWADGFCTAVTMWTDDLEEIGDTVGDPSSLSVDTIEQAAQDANAATEEFVDDVRALGAPDTESGNDVEDAVEALADSVDTERDEIEQAIDDASGITGVTAAVATIGASLSAMATALQSTFETLENADLDGELQAALEQSSACDEIG